MTNMAELYFRPKRWEGQGTVYRLLGVLAFKEVVTTLGRKTGQNSSKPNNYYLWNRSIEGIRAYERKTRSNELMHLAGMVLPLIGLIKGGNGVTTDIILWLVLIVNIHPFLLQRYNRIRINRVLTEKQRGRA